MYNNPITEKATMTQRLERSSRIPGLRLPPAKNDTTASANNTPANAISAGWEKKAVNPPQPSTAKPR